MLLWLTVFGGFVILWALGYLFALTDNFVTVGQMQSHGPGFQRGIPWDAHVGVKYLDALPFPILMATWVYMCGYQWTRWNIVILGVIALIFSAVMHYTYIGAGRKFPEVVTYYGNLPPIFWEHLVYMSAGFAIIGLGYFCSTQPAHWLVWLSTVYLVIHVTLGVHVIHKIWAPAWFPYHKVMEAGTLGPIFGATAVLLGMTWWALR